MKKVISFICLIVCTLIWGTTFIAQDTGMDNIGPFTFNSVRFFVGFLAVAPFVFIFEKKKINVQIKNKQDQFFKLIVPVGTFLFWDVYFSRFRYFILTLLIRPFLQFFMFQWFLSLYIFYFQKNYIGPYGHRPLLV